MKTVGSATWVGRGIALGVAVLVPGLSGGTVALIMGFYRSLLANLGEMRFSSALPLGAGILGGILGGSRVMERLLATHPDAVGFFLSGLVLAGGLCLVGRGTRPVSLWALALGLFAGWLMAGSEWIAAVDAGTSKVWLFAGGFVASSALVVPGLSGASLLILVGQYDEILRAVNQMNLAVLWPFGLGVGLGVVAVGRLVLGALRTRERLVFPLLVGLMMGCVRALWPTEWSAVGMLLFALGSGLAVLFRGVDKSG